MESATCYLNPGPHGASKRHLEHLKLCSDFSVVVGVTQYVEHLFQEGGGSIFPLCRVLSDTRGEA